MSAVSEQVAVFDLGSNTIKVMVFERGARLRCIFREALPTRLSEGQGRGGPLTPQAMERTIDGMHDLLDELEAFGGIRCVAAATSAVREAPNGEIFAARLESETGIELNILTGEEEALGIGRGVGTDPILADLGDNFGIADLGGGSLECLDYRRGEMRQLCSLPLGSVRLSERFIGKSPSFIDLGRLEDLLEYVTDQLQRAKFDFKSCSQPMIATGGAMTATRGILAARKGLEPEDLSPFISCEDMASLLTELASMNQASRTQLPGMPAGRADILPAALATLLGVAELTGTPQLIHSYHNLSYGLASELFAPSVSG